MLRLACFVALSLSLPLAVAPNLAAATRRAHSHRKGHAPAKARFDAATVNDAGLKPTLRLHQSGPAVLRAQILLDRAHYSVGEIDGAFGENMANSVKAYQAALGLPVTGKVDEQTWGALDTDTEPAVQPYTITEKDVAGPFEKIPTDMMEKAQLKDLGYESPEEGLGEKFHCSPKLLSTLNPGKKLDTAGEEITAPNVKRPPVNAKAAKVIVTKDDSSVEVQTADGKVIGHYPATMGSEHDPLPLGDWKLHRPDQNPVYFYNSNLFWDADQANAKAKVPPGPNNPVGVVWIGLSKPHYGIHGTPEPSTIGKTESHGCIRLTNWDAEEVASMVTPGMTAVLREK